MPLSCDPPPAAIDRFWILDGSERGCSLPRRPPGRRGPGGGGGCRRVDNRPPHPPSADALGPSLSALQGGEGMSRVQRSPDVQITLSARRAAISAGEKPHSCNTASVSAPSPGAARDGGSEAPSRTE